MRKVAVSFLLIISLYSVGSAEQRFLPILKNTYKFAAGSDADKAGCKNCHTNPPERNPFGKAVEKALTAKNLDKPNAELFQSLESEDSDGDGYTNGEELKAGFNPGDPASHPAKHAAASTGSTTAAGAGDDNPLFPKHSFHPAIVHFPIGLFVFGVALEFLAMFRKRQEIREAAFWNFVGAALSLLIVVPTGLLSSFRQGYTLAWGQPVFTHFLLAVSASIGIIATAVWQKKSRPVGAGYWILILLTAALVGAAGHFGGNLVY
jgi:uncharacterized membrane protein